MDYTQIKLKYLERMDKLIDDLPIELPKSFRSEARKIIHELAYKAWDEGHNEGFMGRTELDDE